MKSLATSVFWPAWEWVNFPEERSLFGSYDINLALRDSVKCRDIIDSDLYQELFRPNWRFSRSQNAKGNYTNTRQGVRFCFSLGGNRKTGWRGDKIVLDDPLSAMQAYNQAAKDFCLYVWDKVLCTRVNDPNNAKFVIMMQRLAYDDLVGHMIERGNDHPELAYDVVCLPAEFEENLRTHTSIGWTDPRTDEGELLFPDLYGKEKLDEIKLTMGTDEYAGQFQQRPARLGGGRFRKEWFLRWDWLEQDLLSIRLNHRDGRTESVHLRNCQRIVTCDVAVGTKKSNDPTVYSTWAITTDKHIVLLNRWKGRVEEPDSIREAIKIDSHMRAIGIPVSYFAIESNGVGLPLIQNLRNAGLAVSEVSVSSDKHTMSTSAVIRCESGRIHWPNGATWLDEWEEIHEKFPNFSHDDEVTTTSIISELVFPINYKPLQGKPVIQPSRHDEWNRLGKFQKSPVSGPDISTKSSNGISGNPYRKRS